MAEGTRRSSRIPKELAILLVGSDMEGRVFSEKTKTILLSRHGAGIVSEYKLSAEQELILRTLESNKEAEVRVVGQIGSQGNRYIYGVGFLNPDIHFWDIEFASPTESEKLASRALLQCCGCKSRETVDHTDLESDVFAINQSIVRYCQRCGSSTIWKQASADLERQSPTLAAPDTQEDPEEPQRSRPAAAPPLPPVPSPDVSAPPASTPARPENRRKHIRTSVNFKACIRYQSFPDDVVTCEDMSRGGLRFKSRKRYLEKSRIEIAVPYSPGTPAIFVPALIVFVQELAAERLFRYGVAYLHSVSRR